MPGEIVLKLLIAKDFFTVAAISIALFLAAAPALAQRAQGPDTTWSFDNNSPAWPAGTGPLILFSRQHSGFVTNGSHEPLAFLARTDGFRTGDIDGVEPGEAAILVLINNYLPTWRQYPAMEPPSAFSDDEIARVRKWVEEGGSLLILADHAPLGGGVSMLAAAFGFTFLNGHVAEARLAETGYAHVVLDFRPGSGLNASHPITDGSTGRAPIERFHAFGGQALIPPAEATTLLSIPQGWTALLTYDLRGELASAPRIDASGLAQGAAAEFGKGRIAVFGEAGAFSAQTVGGKNPLGFNTANGAENPEFVLSLLRWLARHEPGR